MERGYINESFLIIFWISWNFLSCTSSRQMVQNLPVPQERTQEHMEIIDTIGKFAKIVFDSGSYHFGVIRQGELLSKELFFTNQGEGDLVIQLMSACECTTLDWSRLPIKPGRKSSIKIVYNSKDKKGPQVVDIDIIANTKPPTSSTKFSLWVE